ncbi:MAG: bifunctional pyr operon transcriptional regulator/uracil phosphoribosyltransferase PyrR [Aquisalimonadaceae bacterium]
MTDIASVDILLTRMDEGLRQLLQDRAIDNPLMIGIHTGGAWLAERLHRSLGLAEPLGTLDISFYRDDFSTAGLHPQVRPSSLPFDLNGRNVILVDDVIYSGRTIRAALNEIFDFGRPSSVLLAVLIDRVQRELPIAPDVAGTRLDLQPGQRVKLEGPDPLQLVIRDNA